MAKKTKNPAPSIIHSVSDVYLAEVVRNDEFHRPFAMGIMAPKILVESFPFVRPSLGAFARIGLSKNAEQKAESYDFLVVVEHEERGPAAIARVRFNIDSGPSEFLFRAEFTPPKFEKPGKYFFCLKDQETYEDIVDRVFVIEILSSPDRD